MHDDFTISPFHSSQSTALKSNYFDAKEGLRAIPDTHHQLSKTIRSTTDMSVKGIHYVWNVAERIFPGKVVIDFFFDFFLVGWVGVFFVQCAFVEN